jgi:hypothetical protein
MVSLWEPSGEVKEQASITPFVSSVNKECSLMIESYS